MASNINPAYPAQGSASTQTVRDNFTAAKTEIEALQTATGGGAVVTQFNTRSGNVTLTTLDIAALDLRTLPTSDPGSGKLWINGGGGTSGALWVGPA